MAGLDRDTLSALETEVPWERFIGEDLFGNDAYDPPVMLRCVVTNQSHEYGATDNQGQQDEQRVTRIDLFTNYGPVGVKDRIAHGGKTFYVQSASTGHDERGIPLYHEVSAATVQRG